DLTEPLADRHRARGAAHRIRAVRTLRAELDRDIAACRPSEDVCRQRHRDVLDPFVQEHRELLLGKSDSAERTAHHRSDALAIFGFELEVRVLDGQTRARHGELPIAIESLDTTLLDEIRRMKIDFRCDLAPIK